MSEVNVPLLRKAVEWAEAEHAKGEELSEWYQHDWVITVDTRKRFKDVYEGNENLSSNLRVILNKAPECGTCYCIAGYVAYEIKGDEIKAQAYASDVAAEALGLTPFQAGDLFRGENTIEDIRRIAEEIAGERL